MKANGIQEVVSSILISSTIKNKGLDIASSPFCVSELPRESPPEMLDTVAVGDMLTTGGAP